ncbi:MAG: TonB-dependent receptor plug domain-containing protein, partial [Gammaproteobacteria bacterium]|nr:TonB-dependent receptor plug domain-containing protein [Gammaproteobacteria bacterium]
MNTKKKLVLALPLVTFGQLSQAQTPNESDDFFAEESLPVVLSATRLRQSQLETPAAVTIIDREQIKATGARNVVEVLRQVPGLGLYYSNGSTPEVSIHSLLTEFSRRMQVLVDGQSIFKPGLSRVLWGNLPVNIDEIERIEVVRGPNTSSYGSNAFLGVINIITRLPSDADGHSASILAGNHGIADAYVSFTSQSDSLSYRVSAGYQQDDGFTGSLNGTQRQDANNREYLRADFSYQPNVNNQWRFTLGHSQSEQEIDLLDVYQMDPVHPLDVQDTSLNINWEHRFSENYTFNLNAYYAKSNNRETWRTCPPAFFLTQEMGDLYNLDPAYTQAFVAALVSGMAPPTPPTAEIALVAQQAFIRAGQLGTSVACGNANQDFDEAKWG